MPPGTWFPDLHQIAVATGHAAVAATRVHNSIRIIFVSSGFFLFSSQVASNIFNRRVLCEFLSLRVVRDINT